MKTTLSTKLLIALAPLLIPIASGEPAVEPQPVTSSTATAGTASFWRASEIIGTNVKAANDDTIGEVEDMIVDFKSGQVLGVVISSGGFLGLGDTLSSVPTSALRYDLQAKAFKTKLTKEQLQKAPQYKKDSWQAEKNGMGEKLKVYQNSLAVEPSAADNSGKNKNDDGLTPVDQGTSESDMDRTKDIRKALMDSNLSFNAKNVKIITLNGKVTLRGVVKNASERESVVTIAKKHADASMLDDQLSVKAEK